MRKWNASNGWFDCAIYFLSLWKSSQLTRLLAWGFGLVWFALATVSGNASARINNDFSSPLRTLDCSHGTRGSLQLPPALLLFQPNFLNLQMENLRITQGTMLVKSGSGFQHWLLTITQSSFYPTIFSVALYEPLSWFLLILKYQAADKAWVPWVPRASVWILFRTAKYGSDPEDWLTILGSNILLLTQRLML